MWFRNNYGLKELRALQLITKSQAEGPPAVTSTKQQIKRKPACQGDVTVKL